MRRLSFPINWIQWLTLLQVPVLAIVMVILFVQGEQARHRSNEGLHTFICFFEQAVLASKHQTAGQKTYAINFFDQVNDKIHEPRCPQG